MKKNHNTKFVLISTLLLFIIQFPFLPPCWGDSLLNVKVKTFSLVKNKKIKLGDIAKITGNEPRVVKAAKSIILISAPSMDRAIFIGKGLIKRALSRNGFDLKKVKFIFPHKIIVKNKLNRISEKEIKESIRNYIYNHMPWNKNQVEIAKIDFKGKILLPNGEITQKITSKNHGSFIGNFPVFLEFMVDGKKVRRQKINVQMEVLIPVVLSRVNLKRNQIISEKDIYIEKQWVSKNSPKMLSVFNKVIGKRLKKNLQAGKPLFGSFLETPAVIAKGKRIIILVETKNVRITAHGIAVEAGKQGQIIKVKKIGSNKVLYARVSNESTVRIDF